VNYSQLKAYYKDYGTDSATLTFLSFKNATDPSKESQPVVIHTRGDILKLEDYEEPIDEQWHMLFLDFKPEKSLISHDSKYKLSIFIDNLSRKVNNRDIDYTFSKRHQFIMSYGCYLRDY
jgi:hypothetical protein